MTRHDSEEPQINRERKLKTQLVSRNIQIRQLQPSLNIRIVCVKILAQVLDSSFGVAKLTINRDAAFPDTLRKSRGVTSDQDAVGGFRTAMYEGNVTDYMIFIDLQESRIQPQSTRKVAGRFAPHSVEDLDAV